MKKPKRLYRKDGYPTKAGLKWMRANHRNPSKRKTRKRVSTALKKWLKKQNPSRRGTKDFEVRSSGPRGYTTYDVYGPVGYYGANIKASGLSLREARKEAAYLQKEFNAKQKRLGNPAGRKVKGGRAVSLKNFTGRVIRKSNGQVQIVGRGKKA